MNDLPESVVIGPDVARALADARPVVALESAVISHGLPHPVSLAASAAMDDAVRRSGAVPATIAVLNGRIVAGTAPGELGRLTAPAVMKVAARDLPVAVAGGWTGGTTVSAAIAVAHLIGIPVVSTGGIGGVHLGAEATWDVSADMRALAVYPVVIVCSGAKAICDIGRTLEYLDTLGVTVVAYGTDRFPNFYALDSGYAAPQWAHSPQEIAQIFRAKRALQQTAALLVANPVPAPEALPAADVADVVRRAVAQVGAEGVRGADLTPRLLAAVAEITGGRSLRANLALLRSNAALAGEIAAALAAHR